MSLVPPPRYFSTSPYSHPNKPKLGAHEKHCILTQEERSRLTTIEEEDKDLGGEEDEQVT